MLLTCALKMQANQITKAVALLCISLAILPAAHGAAKKSSKQAQQAEAFADIPDAKYVSDYEFNTFAFPEPIKHLHFAAYDLLKGKPVYLADNLQVLLTFKQNPEAKSVQMIVELESGAAVTLRLVPRSIPGAVFLANGAKLKAAGSSATASKTAQARAQAQADAPASQEDVELLKTLVSRNEPPQGFDPISLPDPTRFDKFTVVPLAGWSDGASKKIYVFSLVAVPGQTAVVSPPQFYRPGISAVLLDTDKVSSTSSPQLFVVETTTDEQ